MLTVTGFTKARGLSLHQGSTENRKTLEQKFIFQISILNPHGTNKCFSFKIVVVVVIQLIYSVVFHVIMHQLIT